MREESFLGHYDKRNDEKSPYLLPREIFLVGQNNDFDGRQPVAPEVQ